MIGANAPTEAAQQSDQANQAGRVRTETVPQPPDPGLALRRPSQLGPTRDDQTLLKSEEPVNPRYNNVSQPRLSCHELAIVLRNEDGGLLLWTMARSGKPFSRTGSPCVTLGRGSSGPPYWPAHLTLSWTDLFPVTAMRSPGGAQLLTLRCTSLAPQPVTASAQATSYNGTSAPEQRGPTAMWSGTTTGVCGRLPVPSREGGEDHRRQVALSQPNEDRQEL